MAKKTPPLKTPTNKLTIAAFGALVVVLILGGYFFLQYQKTKKTISNPSAAVENEVKKLTSRVGKLMVLPTNETPTIATVSDKTKLQDQPFFRNAENGDKVLIYQKAGKIILYRPSLNKLVEVSSVNTQLPPPQTNNPQPTPTISKKITLTVYNGTTTGGLGGQTQAQIEKKYPNAEVKEVKNAAKNNYEKTLVADVTGKNQAFAQELAKFLSADITKIPTDEAKPDTDILVIVGQ